MLFNSLSFLIFLPIVFGLYWFLPHKNQWLLLLIASCYFYMSWNPKYIILIMFTTFVSYLCALWMERLEKKKVLFMLVALVAILGNLFFFKYFNFTLDIIADIFNIATISARPVTLKLLLPVGISFYTFQTLSYVIDVYKGKIRAEHHFGKYAGFVTFFPQLVAGPIERTENLLPQICQEHEFDYAQAVYGTKLMAWGFFKKLVIADNLSMYVDLIYNDIYSYRGLALIVSTIFFSFQIYCDFSGYSDIAVGVAKLFGIDLMKNFSSPYFSASIKEFWSRWHISLSTWFRDYVYIPLGGNRKGTGRRYINLMATFLTSGLWHGANWTFIAWGGLHGILQIIENMLHIKTDEAGSGGYRWRRLFSISAVFVIVCICWIFFRAGTIQEALYVLKHMFDGIGNMPAYILAGYHDLQLSKKEVFGIIISLIILMSYDYISLKKDVIDLISGLPGIVRWGIYYILVFLIILIGNFGSTQFVYFQF